MKEIITNTPDKIPSVEVLNLSNFLNELSTKEPKLHLTILPNIVNDCASVFLEFKKMKINNAQFNKKSKILDDYLRGLTTHQKMSIEFNHMQKIDEVNANKTAELEKIDTYRITKLAELEVERDISISQIEHNTRRTLEEIRSNEKIRLGSVLK